MASTIISNVPPFGSMTNRAIADLHAVSEMLIRLRSAVATATSAYTGVPGTEFEGEGTNFGVMPSDVPGEQGLAYAYAVNVLGDAWQTFWDAAEASIKQLDNGVQDV